MGEWTATSPTGQEYEHCAEDIATVGPLYFRRKRKPTGIICHGECGSVCIHLGPVLDPSNYECPGECPSGMRWEWFYGKVVEE